MKKVISSFVLLFCISVPDVYACTVKDNKLTPEQKQTLIIACEEAKMQSLKDSQEEEPAIDQVSGVLSDIDLSQYPAQAKEIAAAVGLIAKELGLAVDGFLDTKAGKLAAFLLLWKLFGSGIVSFMTGVLLLQIIYSISKKVIASMLGVKSREMVTKKKWYWIKERRVMEITPFAFNEASGSVREGVVGVAVVAALLAVIVVLAVIV